jgi:hypothetical protein
MLLTATASSAFATVFGSDEMPAVPPAVANVLGDQGEGCKLTGTQVARSASSGTLWFVISSCGGSGGQPTWLLLSTPSGSRIVLDNQSAFNIETYDQKTENLPDIDVISGLSAGQKSTDHYSFDGNKYALISSASSNVLGQIAVHCAYDEIMQAIGVHSENDDCQIQVGPLDDSGPEKDLLLVYSQQETKTLTRVWVLSASSRLHIVLEDKVNNQDDYLSKSLLGNNVKLGPSKSHGHRDICFAQTDIKWSCWTYNGSKYARKP